jgi:Flp pilus assembly protein TadG
MQRLARAREAFVRAREGVAAVEFAVIFPFMLLLYLGATEITQTVMASRKATLVARSISDLVAQQPTPTINATDIANIFTAGTAIMSPFRTTTRG